MALNRRSNLTGRLAGLPFTGHRSPFIVRSAVASVVTLGVVGLAATAWGRGAWGVTYVAAGMWALFFFALTPLIIKEVVFAKRAGRALGLIAVKFLGLGLMVGFCAWVSGLGIPNLGLAIIAGVTTPLAVVTLRAAGGALTPPKNVNQPANGMGR